MGYLSFLLKAFGTGQKEPIPVPSFIIGPTAEMRADDAHDRREILLRLERKLLDCPMFDQERVPELIDKVARHDSPFSRPNTKAAFDGPTNLSPDEKRRLGLNTRMKYTHAFIACCRPDAFKGRDPKTTFTSLHLAAVREVGCERELANIRRLGFVRRITIRTGGPGRSCKAAEKFRSSYPIDAPPSLPAPGCNADCICFYEAVLE